MALQFRFSLNVLWLAYGPFDRLGTLLPYAYAPFQVLHSVPEGDPSSAFPAPSGQNWRAVETMGSALCVQGGSVASPVQVFKVQQHASIFVF
jgi:hypothetical protein